MLNSRCIELKQCYNHQRLESPAFDRKVEELKGEVLAIINKEHFWADMAIERMYDDRLDGGKKITDKIPYLRYCWTLFALKQAIAHLEGIEAVRAIHEIELPEF